MIRTFFLIQCFEVILYFSLNYFGHIKILEIYYTYKRNERFCKIKISIQIIFYFCRLPVPWLLYNAAHAGKPIDVDSNGLSCSIVLLFGMLLVVIIVIASSKWQMTKILGGAMLVLYAVFVVFSVLLELSVITCFVD